MRLIRGSIPAPVLDDRGPASIRRVDQDPARRSTGGAAVQQGEVRPRPLPRHPRPGHARGFPPLDRVVSTIDCVSGRHRSPPSLAHFFFHRDQPYKDSTTLSIKLTGLIKLRFGGAGSESVGGVATMTI